MTIVDWGSLQTSLGCCLGLRQWCLCRGVAEVGPVALREDDGSEVDTAGSDEMEWETTRVTCAEVTLAIRERSR